MDAKKAEEIIKNSGQFDPEFYIERYEDVRLKGMQPLQHYIKTGAKENRYPSLKFSPHHYLKNNEEARKSDLLPLIHFILNQKGKEECISNKEKQKLKDLLLIIRSGFWDRKYYLNNNPDIARSKIDPLLHFYSIGGFEGRNPSVKFESKFYISHYSDVQKSGINPLLHFLSHGKKENRACRSGDKLNAYIELARDSGFFDKEYYLKNNPDVKHSKIEPLRHFIKTGGFEGRQPSEKFNTIFYTSCYTDVTESGLNPLIHYLLTGKAEKRQYNVFSNNYKSYTKEEYQKEKKDHLKKFLESDKSLVFKEYIQPELSIILIFFNKAELSFACLQSLVNKIAIPYELIIIDNHSTDQSRELLERLRNVVIIRNNDNYHFIKACNQGAKRAKGSFLLFLNNDTEVMEGSIDAAIRTIKSSESIGAVGAKIILPGGLLQEAGSIIWNDGSCLGYGRGQSPEQPEFNFKRDTDYCSGAFLLTYTHLFRKHGGFDNIFSPAYYEETDFCMWLWQNNYRIIYDPTVCIRHFEFGSGINEEGIRLQKQNQKIFKERHKKALENHLPHNKANITEARHARNSKKKIRLLYIDDQIPHKHLGAGFPRSNFIIECLNKLNIFCTIFPLSLPAYENIIDIYSDISDYTEVIDKSGIRHLENLLKTRKNYYDFIWVSRPHNMEKALKLFRKYLVNAKIIYDAEAIFSDREFNKQKVIQNKNNPADYINQKHHEMSLVANADQIICVSETDAGEFKKYSNTDVKVLGHCLKTSLPETIFEDRKGLLFVGNLDIDSSPNVDSLIWFVEDVLPIIRKKIPDISLHIVGSSSSKKIQSLDAPGLIKHGRVDDLKALYEGCRLFIAPTRYAAGIPYKIHETASYGLPAVCTQLLAKQLQWDNEKYIISAPAEKQAFASQVIRLYNDKELWLKIQKNSLEIIKTEFSQEAYLNKITSILNSPKSLAQSQKSHSPTIQASFDRIDFIRTRNEKWGNILIIKGWAIYPDGDLNIDLHLETDDGVIEKLPFKYYEPGLKGLLNYAPKARFQEYVCIPAKAERIKIFDKISGQQIAAAELRFLEARPFNKHLNLQDNKPLGKTTQKTADTNSIKFKYSPLISIIMPVYNIHPYWLKLAIDSVKSQSYKNWELCICDDASDNKNTLGYLKTLIGIAKIKVSFRRKNGGIVKASKQAIRSAKGEYFLFMDHDDLLYPDCLEEIVNTLQQESPPDIIYADSDYIESLDETVSQFYKPDFSYFYLLSHNYINHPCCFSHSLYKKSKGLKKGYDGCQDFELVLRSTEYTKKIYHIEKILYSWRKTPNNVSSQLLLNNTTIDKAITSIEKHLKRKKSKCIVYQPEFAKEFRIPVFQLELENSKNAVSIIIAGDGPLEATIRCVDSIIQKTKYRNINIILLVNQSQTKEYQNYVKNISHPKIRLEDIPVSEGKSSHSKMINEAVKRCPTELFVLLNNNTEIIEERWLNRMLAYASFKCVAAVGAQLLFPDGKCRHAGIVLQQTEKKIPVYAFYKQNTNTPEFVLYGEIASEKMAVSADCLLTKKSSFELVNGFDETAFPEDFNDVDYCLKLKKIQLKTVYCPGAKLYYHESQTTEKHNDIHYEKVFKKKYKEIRDKYYNSNLIQDASFLNE